MDGWLAILVSLPLTFVASWLGGRFHARVASSHLRVQTMLSFVGGLMLGMALLHLLPHAVVQLGSVDHAAVAALGGMLGIFLLMRFLHVHTHAGDVATVDDALTAGTQGSHDHDHEHRPPDAGSRMRWFVLLSGLGLHSVVDGLAIASAVSLACAHNAWGGLSILLVVMLHKPIDAVSLTATMAASGETLSRRHVVNALFALITPAATVGAYAGFAATGSGAGIAMAVAAGAFICVALADLMPEVQFHAHHRVRLTLALAAGVGLAWGIGILEPAHQHAWDGATENHAGHSHD